MKLDIRLPIGLLFTLIGAILAIFGLFPGAESTASGRAELNINLWWGVIQLAFGLFMVTLALTHRRPKA